MENDATVAPRRLPATHASEFRQLDAMRQRLRTVIQMRGELPLTGRSDPSLAELRAEVHELLQMAKALVPASAAQRTPSSTEQCAARHRLNKALHQNAR